MEYGKKFLILGNNNAITYKEIFPYIKENKLWLGYAANKTMEFQLADDYEKWDRIDETGKKYGKVPAISWFTNIPHAPAGKPLVLEKHYSPDEYPKYDNYDAIEVSKVKDIPVDYYGVMGVPISFLSKYSPDQFEIVGAAQGSEDVAGDYYLGVIPTIKYDGGKARPYLNGKPIYPRILIRRKDRLEPADFEIVSWTRHNDKDMDGGFWKGGKSDATIEGKEVYRRILIRRK